jgi:hypothetical protein
MFACRKTPRPRERNLVVPVLSSLLNLPTFKPSNLPTLFSVSLFLASLTKNARNGVSALAASKECPHQYHSIAFTSSFVFMLLRTLVHHPKSQLFCFHTNTHSLRKTPGVGYPLIKLPPSSISQPCHPERSEGSAFSPIPHVLVSLHPCFVTSHSHESSFTSSTLSFPPVINHQSPVTKSCRIRTSAKRARNSRRIRTSKTQYLKPFRMNTYEKNGEGERVSVGPRVASRRIKLVSESASEVYKH